MTLAAVSDAGPLIHLAEIDSLELLTAFDTLLVPETVLEEITAGGVPDGVSNLSYEPIEVDDSGVVSNTLDDGERAAIVLAKREGIALLTDDLAAREMADDAGIKVRGSIGVIAVGHGYGLLDRDEAAERMRSLQRETSLFVTGAVVERGIQMLDKE